MSKKYYITDHLFPRTSYLMGAGSIFNIAGNYFQFNNSADPDTKAIESDWGIIGSDLEHIIEENPKDKFQLENQ